VISQREKRDETAFLQWFVELNCGFKIILKNLKMEGNFNLNFLK